ncbi:MAG: LamG-like jellyroll fold domain-containing protein [Verrucomicrobiota bacterium JB023]|nr:LamG-like jellyroll fold domain-containing protein [Verrucomicrobiota bacterium JB023]
MNAPINFVLLISLCLSRLFAAEVVYEGVSGGEWATDSNWSTGSYPTGADYAALNTTANLSVEAPTSIRAIRLGSEGNGILQIGSQASLTVGSHAAWDSHLGNGEGHHGQVNQEGGTVQINELEIGRNSSTGAYYLQDGSLTLIRGLKDNSLYLGTDDGKTTAGDGLLSIRSGEFRTRFGVYLGSVNGGVGTFEVIGSHASEIGIGSHGSGDGLWTQNTGSILRVRIDKTAQGITPIFIDEVGEDGGGDVLFEEGSLLDIDFTANFVNGGTFTLMEWEGEVIDHGLQFAPSVDTNQWSFQVDAANKRLTATAVGPPLERAFVHPGLSHKLSDLHRMRDMVAAGAEPWATTFAQLSSHPRAQHTVQPGNLTPEQREVLDGTTNNFLRNDATSAYYNALMWMITGDSRHAEASIRIFNAWSVMKRNTQTVPLSSGRHWRLIEAAEIIKSTYPGWDPGELQAFKDMLVYPGYSNTSAPTAAIENSDVTLYWRCYQGDPARHGNQGLFCMRMVMAMGVFLDNEIMYDRALRYLQGAPAREDDIPYPSGPSIAEQQIASYEHFTEFRRTGQEDTEPDHGYNEVIHNYIWPNGQGQEFSRDMAHGLAGVSIICTMSEIAWSQGDNLYGHLDNRPLLGLEYFYRYNLSYENSYPDQPAPWEPTVENGEFIQRLDRSGRWFSLKANPYLAQNVGPRYFHRGRPSLLQEPCYEMNLGHYRDRLGVDPEDTKWLQRGYDLLTATIGVEPEGTVWDHPSRGGLTFHRVSPGDPIAGITADGPDFAMNLLPMTIEAENYDYFPIDGEGRTYHDVTTNNSGASYRPYDGVDLTPAAVGGHAISSIEPGEWTTYTLSVPAEGDYEVSIHYSSSSPGGTIQLILDGEALTEAIPVPHGAPASTGPTDWQHVALASGITLTQGVKQLKILFGGDPDSFQLNSFSFYQPLPLPLAHWRFDEGSGSIATDCSGNGFHGLINQATWTTRPGGGSALAFDGSTSNVTLPPSAFASLDAELTLAFWAYGDSSLPSENCAFWAGTARGGRILNVHLPWTDSKVYFDAGGRLSQTASEDETENSWTHWAFTKNAAEGTMKIYRNGQLWHAGSNRTSPIANIEQAFIGSEGASRHYPGLLDDFRLYDQELDAATISAIHLQSQATTESEQTWAANGMLELSFSRADGTAGLDWTLFRSECPLVLDENLSPSTPFTLRLSGEATGFDAEEEQSWLIATAPEILGTFSPDTFLIDSAAFEAMNSLNGGSFAVAKQESSLFLTFTPAQYTDLEKWRFQNFGSYENTGSFSDEADFDEDGLVNLLEYALGLNPTSPTASQAIHISRSADGQLEVSFNAIDDPALRYTLEGSSDLASPSWPVIWTGQSEAAQTIVVPQSLWPEEPCHYFRLSVSYQN